MKCPRCKKPGEGKGFCQECKNILLPYFENSQDWNEAYEMERLQQSFTLNYTDYEHDIY